MCTLPKFCLYHEKNKSLGPLVQPICGCDSQMEDGFVGNIYGLILSANMKNQGHHPDYKYITCRHNTLPLYKKDFQRDKFQYNKYQVIFYDILFHLNHLTTWICEIRLDSLRIFPTL